MCAIVYCNSVIHIQFAENSNSIIETAIRVTRGLDISDTYAMCVSL